MSRVARLVAVLLLVLFAAASLPYVADAQCTDLTASAHSMSADDMGAMACSKPCCPLPRHSSPPQPDHRSLCAPHCDLSALPFAEAEQRSVAAGFAVPLQRGMHQDVVAAARQHTLAVPLAWVPAALPAMLSPLRV